MTNHSTGDAIAEVFRRAAEVVQTNGLNQGGFCDISVPFFSGAAFAGGRPVCTVGAMRVAVGLSPIPVNWDEPLGDADPLSDAHPLVSEAVAFLSERVHSPIVDEDIVERVADWNDREGRTADEVAAELLSAAEAVAA
ncbi:hypothetical protein NLX86_06475 [Streptomyces sp. A3M-1-3]|uniref:DUF6197 family protein n=1 Tax=Streptomyces sp. A3M-1-3 TaxID=2962044 RepID=UPI0020B77D47|nr:hypothetical protein [Streptomyces sp. A3M-1-3]MCP3817791.1 hypothetical protein [Streptomyces sp. A3M-1-3]